MRTLIALFLVLMASIACASPCDGIDRSLTPAQSAALAPIISEQRQAKSVEVLQSYRYESWSIIYIDTPEADRAFLLSPIGIKEPGMIGVMEPVLGS
jgi:hypothetical protein